MKRNLARKSADQKETSSLHCFNFPFFVSLSLVFEKSCKQNRSTRRRRAHSIFSLSFFCFHFHLFGEILQEIRSTRRRQDHFIFFTFLFFIFTFFVKKSCKKVGQPEGDKITTPHILFSLSLFHFHFL